MKHLTVRQKVGFWYTAMMILMVASVFLILQLSNMRYAEVYAAETLRTAVTEAADEVEPNGGSLEIDRDISRIDYATIMIYDANGRALLHGPIPDFDLLLQEGPVRKVTGDSGRVWSVYDVYYGLPNGDAAWIRACLTQDSFLAVERHASTLFWWLILLIVVCAALGGRYITMRAFRPMLQINDTARSIVDGNDLTRRIGLSSRKDEFGELAQTFDEMFARLQESFEREKQFTSDASHELRTPLSVIQAQCDYALGSADTAAYEQSIGVIQKQAARMSVLLNQLLFLSRADKGTQMLYLERVNLSDLMESVAQELSHRAGQAEIRMETRIQPNVVMMADELLMIRMLVNLTENAVRFGKKGGFVRLALRTEASRIVGTVEDNGLGIAPGDLPHIWERFFQADASRQENHTEGSSGLGLPMVRWIVRAHHGEIHAQSALGEGSVFTFTFPIDSAG